MKTNNDNKAAVRKIIEGGYSPAEGQHPMEKLMSETKRVSAKDFEGKSLMIATPCYGGKADVPYIISVTQTAVILTKFGIKHDLFMIGNDSLVMRARNTCVARFMEQDFTHLIFIDADGEFNPSDVLKFLDADEDVLAAAAPKKKFPIEYNTSVLKDESGHILTHKDRYLQVEYVGCAFTMIKREVIEKMFDHYKDLKYEPYVPDGGRAGDLPTGVKKTNMKNLCYSLFDTSTHPSSREAGDGPIKFYGEDYMFCHRWREIGGKILLDPTVKINHIGQYKFEGDLSKI